MVIPIPPLCTLDISSVVLNPTFHHATYPGSCCLKQDIRPQFSRTHFRPNYPRTILQKQSSVLLQFPPYYVVKFSLWQNWNGLIYRLPLYLRLRELVEKRVVLFANWELYEHFSPNLNLKLYHYIGMGEGSCPTMSTYFAFGQSDRPTMVFYLGLTFKFGNVAGGMQDMSERGAASGFLACVCSNKRLTRCKPPK